MIADCETCTRRAVPCSGCEESQRTICYVCQGDVADPYCEAPACKVLPFPPAAMGRLTSRVALLTLAGAPFASAGFLPGNPGDAWAWIQETVVAELGCSAEQVHAAEGEEGCDVVTVDGLPVYQVEITRPAAFGR